jgi:crotonobetainyl-CoA:carnitine CoA-transferase CaiB-like acyl-CoA transferase
LANDQRFADADRRLANIELCVELLEGIFAERTLRIWTAALKGEGIPYSVVQTPKEAQHDVQARINGFVQEMSVDCGVTLPVTVAPAQFDEEAPIPSPAPGHARDTDQVLLESGFDWEEIMDLKLAGAIA